MKKPPIYIFTLTKDNTIDVEKIDFNYTFEYNDRRPNTSVTLWNHDTNKCRVYKQIPKNPGQVFNNRIWLYHNDIDYAKEKLVKAIIKKQRYLKKEINRLEEVIYELVEST